MFKSTNIATISATDSPDTSNVITMHAMFAETPNFNGNVSLINTSNVTNMSFMFASAPVFNQSVANFDTSNAITMEYMF
jgi:hypothetical protein